MMFKLSILNHKSKTAGGMTLVELLVAVTILVVMILAFSVILTQSQKVVSAGQGAIRSNAAAAAIAKVLRDDLRQVTQNGFLCITIRPGNIPMLVLTKAGTSYSKVSSVMGTGSVVAFSFVNNSAPNANGQILWHPEWILASSGSGNDVLAGSVTLASLCTLTRPQISATIDNIIAQALPLTVPVNDLSDINNIWKVLAIDCNATSFEIKWTDGTDEINNTTGNPPGDGNMDWYGISYVSGSYQATAKGGGAVFELDPNPTTYRAIWTREDPGNWPKAIKIRFTIQDEALPKEFTATGGIAYEVICPVGQ